MLGNRCASIDLPVPGGPTISKLCPPAAAISNAKLLPSELDTLAQIDDEAKQALAQMLEKLSLSARSFHRILRVSRTLADLAGDTVVTRGHVLQAIGFRRAI